MEAVPMSQEIRHLQRRACAMGQDYSDSNRWALAGLAARITREFRRFVRRHSELRLRRGFSNRRNARRHAREQWRLRGRNEILAEIQSGGEQLGEQRDTTRAESVLAGTLGELGCFVSSTA